MLHIYYVITLFVFTDVDKCTFKQKEDCIK